MISLYNIPNAIKELERCKKQGMIGCMIWQVPPDHLPFTSDYYNPFWEAASELDMPVNVHILTGFNYSRFDRKGLDIYRMTVNHEARRCGEHFIRFRLRRRAGEAIRNSNSYTSKMKSAGFRSIVHEWDKYFVRHGPKAPLPYMKKLPSEYVQEQVYATFFSDPAGGRMMEGFGEDNFHVVQRLSACRFDVAALARSHRQRNSAICRKPVIDKVVRTT